MAALLDTIPNWRERWQVMINFIEGSTSSSIGYQRRVRVWKEKSLVKLPTPTGEEKKALPAS